MGSTDTSAPVSFAASPFRTRPEYDAWLKLPTAEQQTKLAATAAPPISALLGTCKTACDDMTEFVEAVYKHLAKEPGAAVLKEDKSFFSLADGVVQVRVARSPHTSLRGTRARCAPSDNPRRTMLNHDVENSPGC